VHDITVISTTIVVRNIHIKATLRNRERQDVYLHRHNLIAAELNDSCPSELTNIYEFLLNSVTVTQVDSKFRCDDWACCINPRHLKSLVNTRGRTSHTYLVALKALKKAWTFKCLHLKCLLAFAQTILILRSYVVQDVGYSLYTKQEATRRRYVLEYNDQKHTWQKLPRERTITQ
jgi:hypothetical protein